MKIRGVITVEGVELHVDIDAPDGQRELYVTNVQPDCLVIPKDRWKVEFLGLPNDVLAELHRQNLFSLGQLVDETWNIGANGLSEEVHASVKEALDRFRDIALVFEQPRVYTGDPRTHVETHEVDPKALETDIATIGLLMAQEDALRKMRDAKTFGDLVKLGRNRLMMTNHMDEKGMRKIEDALRQAGIELPQ